MLTMGAQFSECRRYRYSLTRAWAAGPVVTWIMLNPSSADETRDDPTIKKCIGYSLNQGFAGLVILNLFGFRSTYPHSLMTIDDPVGPRNDAALSTQVGARTPFVCAWGNEPFRSAAVARKLGPRVFDVLRTLAGEDLRVLKLTELGQPAHPLYLKSSLRFTPWKWKPLEAR